MKLEDNTGIVAAIERNVADEAKARQGYYDLIDYFNEEADIAVIKEIISDELNHSEKLKALAEKYGGIKPSKD